MLYLSLSKQKFLIALFIMSKFRFYWSKEHDEGATVTLLYTLVVSTAPSFCSTDTDIDLPPNFSVSLFTLMSIAMETQRTGITVKLRAGLLERAGPPDCERLV